MIIQLLQVRPEGVAAVSHADVTRRSATEGMVLLKNEGQTLPMDGPTISSTSRRVPVIPMSVLPLIRLVGDVVTTRWNFKITPST